MKSLSSQPHTKGQAIMISVIFFLIISLTIVFGITEPIVRQLKIVNDSFESKKSYYLSEALTEDILYRLNNSMTVASSEVLAIDGYSATSTIVTNGGQREITSVASVKDLVRKTKAIVNVGDGIAFNYGVQAGNGGFTMGNTAQVVGNVYSNGNITGGEVTESAIAANSISLITDQENALPTTPSRIASFGTTATQDIAQSFQVSTTSPINNVEVYLRKSRTQNPGDITVRIVTDNSGVPSGTTLVSKTIPAAQVSNTLYGWKTVTFTSNPELTASTTYWLVLDASSNANDYYFIGANTTYANGSARAGTYNSSLTATTSDVYFKLSLGGITSTISGVDVGGDAWGHTISGGSVGGVKYCQVGTGCNTTRADPSPTSFPISAENITDWKADAEAGGTISGNYTPAAGSTLGPKKITGNLIISNNFTVTGTIWVQGNITTSNGKIASLASGYATSGGIIVVDGTTAISNNAQFNGSGQAGSFMMIVSTNTGSNAIDVSNNAGAVILNAQYGTIHFNNNAGAKEATAYAITMDNGATVTYESGLSNANFSSGPSGAWGIDSWQEIE